MDAAVLIPEDPELMRTEFWETRYSNLGPIHVRTIPCEYNQPILWTTT